YNYHTQIIEPTKKFKDATNKINSLDQKETDELILNEFNKLIEEFGKRILLNTPTHM
ncbi:13097_t:CDS:1, partial [Gigaspora margarita]